MVADVATPDGAQTHASATAKHIDSFLFQSMRSPAFNQSSHKMRSVIDMAILPTARFTAGGVAALMTKTTKTA